MRLLAALFALAPLAAGANQSMPGCEARPEVRQVFHRDLDYRHKLSYLKQANQNAY